MRVPLARPEVPALAPLAWPATSIAIFGVEDGALAEAFLEGWREEDAGPIARLDVALRHAPGADVGPSRIDAHPDALAEALARAREETAAPVVGVGAAFAAAVTADLVVFSGAVDTLPKLPEALRAVARRASLVLEEPRPEVSHALGRRAARLERARPRP